MDRRLKLVSNCVEERDARRFVGELWSSAEKQMHSLHYVISYRASFKPEIPDFCIQKYSGKGDVVLDPFVGRGTTALQANLLGRVAYYSDINPLAVRISTAKTKPIGLDEVVLRLNEIDFRKPVDVSGYNEYFSPFYHPDTFRELLNLKVGLRRKRDQVADFVQLIAISRLHGHTQAFFSVYSFPQLAIPPESQRIINAKRRQVPDYRSVAPRIIRKAAQALRDGFTNAFFDVADQNRGAVSDSRDLKWLPSNSVDLVVTAPPTPELVDPLADNWLEAWMCDLREDSFSIQDWSSISSWREFIRESLAQLLRVVKPGGYVVLEVGEINVDGGSIAGDEVIAEESAVVRADGKCFKVSELLIHQRNLAKLSNCFSQADNPKRSAETTRLVVLKCVPLRRKP